MISVVVPAHDEQAVIGRMLTGLLADAAPGEFEVVVVANGCTDDTAAVAARFGPPVDVVATPVRSKQRAMRMGDARARSYPRLYVDADVVLRAGDARALADALRAPGVLAAAPQRDIELAGRPRTVRWYYDVWQRLPVVQEGLWGRGVIGVSPAGQARLAALPQALSDDLAAALAFGPGECRVVGSARVTVQAPRRAADLIRRRVRTLTGTAQLRDRRPPAGRRDRTRTRDLVALAGRDPRLVGKMLVFLAVTALARWRARRRIRSGDFTTWLRDESSRAA